LLLLKIKKFLFTFLLLEFKIKREYIAVKEKNNESKRE